MKFTFLPISTVKEGCLVGSAFNEIPSYILTNIKTHGKETYADVYDLVGNGKIFLAKTVIATHYNLGNFHGWRVFVPVSSVGHPLTKVFK
jgi:hypothetical protein